MESKKISWRLLVLLASMFVIESAFSQVESDNTVFYNYDGNVFVDGFYINAGNNELVGGAFGIIVKPGAETMTNFSWRVPFLTGVLVPEGWSWAYDSENGLLTIFSLGGGLSDGQRELDVDFTFGHPDYHFPVDSGLVPGEFCYEGATTGGAIGVPIANAVPWPKILSLEQSQALAVGAEGTNHVALAVRAAEGGLFQVETTLFLTAGSWSVLGSYSATGEVTVVVDTNTVSCKYYRVIRQ